MDGFWGNLFREKERKVSTQTLLKQIPIFSNLNKRELTAVEHILHRREYTASEMVFRQGDPGVGMYIVDSGDVAIIYDPTQQVLAEYGQGDFFGEVALFNETPRSASALSRTASTLLFLFQPDLLDLIQRMPRLGVKVLLNLTQIAGHRLIRLSDQNQALRMELDQLKVDYKQEPLRTLGEQKHSMD